jgi:hypothetical protein
MSKDDLWASVISTCHLQESECEFGMEVKTKLEEGTAKLRIIMHDNPSGERVKYAGPFRYEDLKYAAKVLNQAARLLDTKRKAASAK